MNIQTQTPLLRPEAAAPVESDDAIIGLPPSLRPRWLAPFRQSGFSIGLLLLILSGTLFGVYDALADPRQERDNNGLLIVVHYGLAVAYSIFLLVHGFLKFRRQTYAEGRPARWVGLLLWLISAYALNREMAVFQQSTNWLCGALLVVGGAMVAYAWKDALSVRVQQLLYAVLAIGVWLFAYMALYVAPLYPISVPLLIALGLSAHTFVPLVFAITLGKRLWYDTRREEHLQPGLWLGLLLPVGVLGWFLTGWARDLNRIETTRQEATLRRTTDLPDWVLVAQQLRPSWITNRLLLAGRTFDTGRFFDGDGWNLSGLTALDDVRQHDPLVVIASRLFPADVLADTDKLALLKVRSAQRHGAEEKFWTGRHLTTEDVTSQVRIWPQFRLAYTEQTFCIRNQARNTTEEALLTFHLPAGSVVSGMALWVNGREEPARLTTVAKADSAYRQVVAIESRSYARDPSVVYWQEGNRVTVRVFPCRAGDDRRVKLGITSPLRLTNGQLIYQPPYVEGPDAGSAHELIQADFDQLPDGLQTPWSFSQSGGRLMRRGSYTADWSLRFAAPALSAAPFVLDGRAYRMHSYQPTLESFSPTDVYVDVNAAWSSDEFKRVYETVRRAGVRVWAYDDGMQALTDSALDATYERLSVNAFSLFPIYRIANPATALLVTKGTTAAPTLSDLKASRFAQHFALMARHTVPIRTVYLNDELSPYLKTLAELRVLNVRQGTPADLTRLVQTRQFPKLIDTDEQVVLADAGVVIQETPESAAVPTTLTPSAAPTATAPDHLARLFAYNHLLRQIGRHYFEPNYQTDALIRQAQRANVVSPLSSLIVLETAADYERFGIHKDASGLANATLKEEGAVPEPHEWALLTMVVGLATWLWWKRRLTIPDHV